MNEGKWPNGLAAAMERAAIGPTALGRLIGDSKQNVDRWAKQQRKLKPEMAAKIAPHLDTTAAELLLLPDETKTRSASAALAEVMKMLSRLTPAEQAVLVETLQRQRSSAVRQVSRPAPKERTSAKSR